MVKNVPKFQQLVSTLNYRKNRSIEKSPRDVKNSDFLSILYNKSFKKYTKPNFKIGIIFRISKNDIPFRKVNNPQFTDEVFEISAISTKKPPRYIINHLKKEKMLEKFYENELEKCSD